MPLDDDDPGALAKGVLRLTCDYARTLRDLTWSDAAAVAAAEKRGRIISTHRTNVEKILSMDLNERTRHTDAEPDDGARRELERRLRRHASALGKDELARRLEARGLPTDPDALERLAKARSGDAARGLDDVAPAGRQGSGEDAGGG